MSRKIDIIAGVMLIWLCGLSLAVAQGGGSQLALCSMEADARASEAELARAASAETNPIKK